LIAWPNTLFELPLEKSGQDQSKEINKTAGNPVKLFMVFYG
jgi:hypothetical protein